VIGDGPCSKARGEAPKRKRRYRLGRRAAAFRNARIWAIPSLLSYPPDGFWNLGFQRFFVPDANLALAFGPKMLLFSRASFEKGPKTACFMAFTM
jgi:hypothetical protein